MACEDANPRMHSADEGSRGRYHVVCLIDIQGQGAKLAKWAQPPPSLQPTPEFTMAVDQTVGTVHRFRHMFEEFFHESGKPRINQRQVDNLPKEKIDLYRRARECRLRTQQFADTFVFYAPVLNVHDDKSTVPLYQILAACCMAMTRSLADRIPLRGAVCIGMGLELAERNFYGPALAEAHHLESKEANYPRILVSAEAARFAQASGGFSPDDSVNAAMKSIAEGCYTLLCEDHDKKVIVDFLGQGAYSVFGGTVPSMKASVEKAYCFVRTEAVRFRQAGDEKLAPRYALLLKYMEDRLPIWGLKHLIGQ